MNRIFFNPALYKGLTLSISKTKLNSSSIIAKISVKRGQQLVQHILHMLYIIGGKITPNWAKISSKLAYELYLLHTAGGPKQVVKYLKVASIVLQQVAAGYELPDITPLGMRISRSKSGLPRLIPSDQRKLICEGNKKVLRFWLTVFSIYRDIHFDGELKLSTILNPISTSPDWCFFEKFTKSFKDLFFMTCKFSPDSNHDSLFQILTSGPQVSKPSVPFNTHPVSIIRSLQLFLDNSRDGGTLFTSLKFLAGTFIPQEF
jgi:hypothetical protein